MEFLAATHREAVLEIFTIPVADFHTGLVPCCTIFAASESATRTL